MRKEGKIFLRKEGHMKRIGIIGLGMLGYAVTKHLLDLNFQVTGYNRTLSKAKVLERRWIKRCFFT